MKYLKLLTFAALSAVLIWACTSEQEPIPDDVDCNTALTITIGSQVDVSCGQNDGGFTVTVVGGSGNYTYQIGSAAVQTSAVFENLAAGSYTVTVVDIDLGCTLEVNAQVRNEDGVNATAMATASDCDNADGSIQVTATDGSTPYQYKLDDGAFQSSSSFTGLGQGTYTVTVRDANGCETEVQAQVRSDVTFGEIRTLVQTNCAVSGCHDGTQSPDFRNDSNITGQAGRIRARTSARTMPPSSSGRSLSNEEIASIVCWVNDGAPGS